MKIEYMSKPHFKSSRHDMNDGLHVVIVHNIELVQRYLEKQNVKIAPELLLGRLVIIKKMQVIFYLLKEKDWFLEVKDICNSLQTELKTRKRDEKVLMNKFYIHVDKIQFQYKRSLLISLFKEVYQFKKYVGRHNETFSRHFYIIDSESGKANINEIIRHVMAGKVARDIATEPSNAMYPEKFCAHVQTLFKAHGNIKVRCLSMKEMKKLGLNLIVAVGKSAQHEPKMMIIEYMPKPKEETICLVGKGVVFDAGGYNIKGNQSMWGMKGDKTGGAIVVGIFDFLAKMKERPQCNIVGLIPLVENLVSHSAAKPGDIVTTYNGVTVEIVDTDAEGRLIMADAFAYLCDKYKPKYIVDFATLTGWSQLMHCDTSYVYYTMDDKVSDVVEYIGNHVGERSVRMPVWPEYVRYTRSAVADYKNFGFGCKRSGGFMAAMFLMNFIKPAYRDKWIHFDITHSETESLHNCNGLATGIDFVLKHLTSI